MSGPGGAQPGRKPHGRPRGIKEAQSIIDAAVEQGWTFEQGTHHWKLVPPNGGPPVGIAGTPSNKFRDKVIVSQLRKSGFIWPWPQPPHVRPADMRDIFAACREQGYEVERSSSHIRIIPPDPSRPMVTVPTRPGDYREVTLTSLRLGGFRWDDTKSTTLEEEWVPVPKCPAYEFSNTKVCREKATGKIVTPCENGNILVFDERGRKHFFSPKAVFLAAFVNRPKLSIVKKEETPVSVPSIEIEPPSEELDSGQREAERTPADPLSAQSLYPHKIWEIVLIEGVVEGYDVSTAGDVLAPPIRGKRKLLVPGSKGGQRVVVQLRRTDGKYRGYPLDEIVLEAFQARPTEGSWFPKHVNGKVSNCALANLRWAKSTKPIPKEKPVSTLKETNPTSARLLRERAEGDAARKVEEANAVKLLDDLAECKGVAAAEQFHSDYPEGNVTKKPTNPAREFFGYPEDHIAQDEELIEAYSRGHANAEDEAVERVIDAAVASGELNLEVDKPDFQVFAETPILEPRGLINLYGEERAAEIVSSVVRIYEHKPTHIKLTIIDGGATITPNNADWKIVQRLFKAAEAAQDL